MTVFSFDIKERIREAIDIVEFVSRYMPLRRSGRHYVGKCPWHDDSRPSLQINSERQSYKCWVCNLGGDIFSFVMQMEGVEFREAMEILADHAGIDIPKYEKTTQYTQNEDYGDVSSSAQNTSSTKEPITKKTLFRALDWAASQYHNYYLTGSEAESVRQYISERGINDESVRKFQIGFAPIQRDWIIKQANASADRIKVLEISGILARYEEENSNAPSAPYDRFRGRLLFPIRDTQDRTVAFGGRVLPNSPLQSRAKYVNSPETPVFSKHKMLYGLDIARLAMRKTRRVLIMEGYTDVIIAHQFGFDDAVAVLGTALGSEHIRILKRFVDKMVLVLDGDEAGRKRADEVLELFVAQGADIETLTLPNGNDPCEFLLKNGSDAFRDLLEHNTVDALAHAFQSATRGIDLSSDVIGATRALDKILAIISHAPAQSNPADPMRIRLEKTIQKLSERFGLPEKEIRGRLRQLRQQKQASATVHNTQQQSKMDEFSESFEKNEEFHDFSEPSLPVIPWELPGIFPDQLENELLETWLTDPAVFDLCHEKIPNHWLFSPVTRLIYQVCSEFSDAGELPTFDRLITRFDDLKMKSFLVERDEAATEKQLVVTDRLITEIVSGFEQRNFQRSRPKDLGRLRAENLSSDEKLKLLLEIQQKQRARHGITEPKEG